ncbi:MAG: FAD-dependent monooxygenase, partial [Hyphomicrobiaceae bacterium]
MDERAPVLIAGAGIAGLSLSLSLAARNQPSIILERRQALSEAGAGIQLGPNAVRVLDRLGVSTHLKSMSGRPQAIVVADGASGRALGRLPLGGAIENRHGAPYLVAHRGDLQSVLVAAVKRQPLIRLLTDWTLSSWQEAEQTVIAYPDGGAQLAGSALIGADGIWSTVRRRLHPVHPLTYS